MMLYGKNISQLLPAVLPSGKQLGDETAKY
jgi:hypothetical protein